MQHAYGYSVLITDWEHCCGLVSASSELVSSHRYVDPKLPGGVYAFSVNSMSEGLEWLLSVSWNTASCNPDKELGNTCSSSGPALWHCFCILLVFCIFLQDLCIDAEHKEDHVKVKGQTSHQFHRRIILPFTSPPIASLSSASVHFEVIIAADKGRLCAAEKTMLIMSLVCVLQWNL